MLARMRRLGIVGVNPGIYISLQLLYAGVYLTPEGDSIKLILNRLMKPLTNPVGLRSFSKGHKASWSPSAFLDIDFIRNRL